MLTLARAGLPLARAGLPSGLRSTAKAMTPMMRTYIIPTRKQNVVPVYEQTPRLIPKGKTPLDVQTEKMFKRYDPAGEKQAMFSKKNPACPKAGDVLRVVKKDKSSFVGMLLALNRNHLGTTILLRTKISGVGVEMRFQVYHPDIEKVELLRVPTMRWPKEKYYFVRNTKKHDAGDLDGLVRRQARASKR